MMSALQFLVETLLSLVFFVVLLRLLLQWARADFRNPLAVAVMRLSNWLILPLRRVLPPIGRIDTATVLAVLVIAFVEVGALYFLRGYGTPLPLEWTRLAALEIVRTTLWTYFYATLAYGLLGLIAPGVYSPAQSLLESLCEPILKPLRRTIPAVGGLDLSPLWAIIIIQMLLILLRA
jgi:YggT family protein